MNKLTFELWKLATINESIEDKGILHACYLGGSPGAGKSFVTGKIKSGQIEPKVVNTDTHVEFLAKLHGINVNDVMEKWPTYGKKIKKLNSNQLALYLNSMLPLFIDGTSSNPNNLLRRTGILKGIGYDTGMIWVETSLKTALERNKKRERNVDEDFLIETHKKIQNLKSYYQSEFKFFVELKNDEGELSEDVVLKAFKKTTSFFNSDVKNFVGKSLIEEMRKNRHKYLIDTDYYNMGSIKKLINGWYAK